MSLANRVDVLEGAEYRRAERSLLDLREWIDRNASPAEVEAFQRWVASLFLDGIVAGGPYNFAKELEAGEYDAAVDGPVLEGLGARVPVEVRGGAVAAFQFAELEAERWSWVRET